MKPTTKQTVRNLLAHFHFKVKYAKLPDNLHGFLSPERGSRTIVLNARKSKSDHIFTSLHELAHYILHVRRFYHKKIPRLFTRKWKSKRLRGYSRLIKRNASRVLTEEREADMWAFCAMYSMGATDDLKQFFLQCPEKAAWGLLTAFCFALIRIKSRLQGALSKLSLTH